MVFNAENENKNSVKGVVLFTGSGSRVIDDLMRHVSEPYQLGKCAPIEMEFIGALDDFKPHTVVVCLADETRETLKMLAALRENPKYFGLPVIGIGNEDDCDFFEKIVIQKHMEVFTRPLDHQRFMGTLKQYVEQRKFETAQAEAKEKAEQAGAAAQPAAAPEEAGRDDEALLKKMEKAISLHGRKTVLVVDDDVRMLNVIKLYLQDLYDVVVVPSGKLALKYLSKKSTDLVLLDYMMPEEDGPEVLRQIREESHQPNIPVVFLTGVADKEKVMRGLEFHPNGYLLKPVTRVVLLEKVTEILLGL